MTAAVVALATTGFAGCRAPEPPAVSWSTSVGEETAALDPCTGPAGKDLEGKIAFASDRTGNYEIFVMNTDGSGVTRVTDTPTDDREPVWSPDGTRIAFSSERSGNTDILVVNADGTGMAKLTDHPATDDEPAWQPRAPRPPVTSPSAASPPLPATT